MDRRGRLLRLGAWLAGGTALGVALALAAVFLSARTSWGHERILEITLRALGKGVQGTLTVARIDGNLLTGARLYDVALRGRDGVAFILADSADLRYDVRTLLSPRIIIRRATLYDATIFARRLPGDSLWNYQAIFADTTAGGPPSQQRVTQLDTVVLVRTQARVESPWDPGGKLTPRERRAAVADALSDSSLLLVRRVPSGFLRTMTFADVGGVVTGVRFAPGSEAGSFFRIDSLSTRARVFRWPVDVRAARGRVALLKEHVEFDFSSIRLPGSRLAAGGVVTFPPDSADLRYDVLVLGRQIAFRDLQWLYPRFPAAARGSLTLRIETRPDGGLLYLARNVDVRAPGTRLRGSFGVVVGDTVRFTDVNLKADPLRVATIEAMLPQKLPVAGLRIGAAGIRGTDEGAAADTLQGRRNGSAPSRRAP